MSRTDNARILQLQGGELDGMFNVPTGRVDELAADPNLQVLQLPSSYSQYVVLNHKVAPLDDVNVRLALNYATDKQTLIQVALFGNGVEATSFMPKGALFWNDTLAGLSVRLDKAKAYLAKSKVAQRFPDRISVPAGNAEIEQLATAIKDMWTQIGVDVRSPRPSSSAFNANFSDETFQAIAPTGPTTSSTRTSSSPLRRAEDGRRVSYRLVEPGGSRSGGEGARRAGPGEAEADVLPDPGAVQSGRGDGAALQQAVHRRPVEKGPRLRSSLPPGQWVWKETWIEQ